MQLSKAIFASFFSGLLLVSCYAPFDLWVLAYLALVPLMLATRSTRPLWTAAYYGLTGAVLSIGIYYGAMGYGVNAIVLIVLSFSITFALWGGLTSWIVAQYPEPAVKIFAPALLWIGIETLAGNLPLGVPMYLGLSHAGQPWLIQSASWFGISSVSFLIILGNSLLAYVFLFNYKQKPVIWPVLLASVILLANPVLGHWRLSSAVPASTEIRVAAIQPHINSETYISGWQHPENRVFMHDTLQALTQQAVESGAQIVFWAEGGNGYMNMRVAELRESLTAIARDAEVDLIISSSDMNSDGQRFNSLFSIAPGGQLLGRYDKQRLLPLAEVHLTQGIHAQPLQSSRGSIGAVICYESTFPEPLRTLTSQGAELLFVTSSEAAFKRSPLALHNARLAVFRAVENHRWLVRAANTGPSLIVSPLGNIINQSEFDTRGILTGNVMMLSGTTFFTRSGFLLPKAIAVAVIILAGYILLRSLRKQHKISKRILPLHNRMVKIIRPFFTASLVFVLIIMATITSSLYIVNREFLHSRFTISVLLTELFSPAVLPMVDTVGKDFLQAGNNTCGAAALAYVVSFLGRETKEEEIVKMIRLNERGTSLLELKNAAVRLKFSAIGVDANFTALRAETLPVIAYINDSHYVVVTEVGAWYVNVFDPALGHVRLTRSLFEQTWNGYLLLVRPGPIPNLLGNRSERFISLHTSSI